VDALEEERQKEAEVVYRLLIVMGTLIYRDVGCTDIAAGLNIPDGIKAVAKQHSKDKNVSEIAAELAKAFEVQKAKS